jgi:hypothetical protein
MAYRDDLQAALEHAESAERELEKARAENAEDEKKIAALEKQLADAKRRLGETEKREQKPAPKPEPSKSSGSAGGIFVAIGAIVLVVGGAFLFALSSPNTSKLGRQLRSKKTVDISRDLAEAQAEAQKYMPDPVLQRIEADYVDPRGITDLEAFGGEVRYRFTSPSRAKAEAPPHQGPIGAPDPPVTWQTCEVYVTYHKNSMKTSDYQNHGDACGKPMRAPSCTVAEVWQEALRRGAPQNALAHVRLDARHKGPTWEFRISDRSHDVFSMDLPDNCPLVR